jgi:peptide/nickel transport system permease protein
MNTIALLRRGKRGAARLGAFMGDPISGVAITMLLVLALIAILAPWISPQNPYDLSAVSISDAEIAPGQLAPRGNFIAWLGTDGAGRDLLSAIMYGLRTSLLVGLLSTAGGLAIGLVAGLAAAYFGGALDSFIARAIDLQLSVPAIMIALVILAALGPGLDKVVVALIATQWAYHARTIRSSALSESAKEYVEAAHSQGLPVWRIILLHVLPNCLAPALVVASLQLGHAFALEATLSFLGVGLPRTSPSLGLLISNGFEYIMADSVWICIFPGVALVLLVISVNLVCERIRVVASPRSQA